MRSAKSITSIVPSDWEIVKLAILLQRVRKPVKVEADELYREIGIFSHGKGIFHKKERTGASLGNKSVFWIEPDCFVVNVVFAWEQAVAKTTIAEKGMIASHRFPMYKPKDGALDLDFLVYYFKTPRGKHLLGLASPGGAGRNKTLGQQAFLDLSIPLPPFPEQRKITAILGMWDKAIALTERRIEAAHQRKKALMQRLLTGRVRFPEFAREVWREVRLKECCTGTPQYGANASSIEYDGSLPRYIRITDIDNNSKLIDGTKVSIHFEGNEKFVLKHSDFLFARSGATVGKTYLYQEKDGLAIYAGYLIKFSIDSKALLPEYLKHYTQTHRYWHWVQSTLRAGAQPNINAKEYASLPILLPPLPEQRRIAAVLQTCDREIELLAQERDALQRQKKGLMQQLLTGRTRVKAPL